MDRNVVVLVEGWAMIVNHLPWLVLALTVCMVLMGWRQHPKTWALALAIQAIFLLWILAAQAWGALPLNCVLALMSWRNHRRWGRP
ncbi:hypothetical protein [Delftia tsuruhatensis]|uniref:hypothetical protein n=1 Tax=Delftia tsuruhatensis TaxID=180282 RepID=UPI003A845CD7